MKLEGKVSVIISVFKAESFLRRCVDSILNQTHKDIELILVHDPTGDKGGEICDEYAQRDTRVKVIHREKAGSAASARNEGLRIATGQYIGFIDSDDWMEKDTFEYAINIIQLEDADVIQFDYEMTSNEHFTISNPVEKLDIYRNKEALEYLMLSSTQGTAGFVVWRCLFKANTLKDIFFRDTFVNEDMDWKYRAFNNCNKLVVSNQKKYYYFQYGDSLSAGGLKKKDFGLFDSVNALNDLTSHEEYGNIRYLGEVKKARTEFSLLCKAAYYGISDPNLDKKETIRELTKGHRKNAKTLLKAPLPLSRKVLVVLLCISFPLTERIVHLIK